MPRTTKPLMNDERYAGMHSVMTALDLNIAHTDRLVRNPDYRTSRDRLKGELEAFTLARNAVEKKVRAEQERRQEAVAHG